MRVWVTRAQPLAEATAQRLVALGHTALVAPLLEVRLLPFAPEALGDAGAMALTSQTAVQALAPCDPQVRGRPAFAVGAATAQAAVAAGFTDVRSAHGDVAALTRLILASRAHFSGPIIHASALEPAGDLTGALNAAGCPARRVSVYDTVATGLGAVPGGAQAVLIHSAKAARAAAAVISPLEASALRLYGLSEAALAPLNALKFAFRSVAPFANEAAVLSLLSESPAASGSP
jgi:uroporphyrinogen-III synthase